MQRVLITVASGEDRRQVFITEAAWDLMLNAMEIGLEGASDGANDAHVDEADEARIELRSLLGDPYEIDMDGNPVSYEDLTGTSSD